MRREKHATISNTSFDFGLNHEWLELNEQGNTGSQIHQVFLTIIKSCYPEEVKYIQYAKGVKIWTPWLMALRSSIKICTDYFAS